MIWSKETLARLNEHDLCRDVLIPLFEQIGFQHVYYYHGGPLEQGKDIVMWKSEQLRGRLDYAVVAKVVDIKGGVSSNIIQTVVLQIQQCLNTPYADPRGGEQRDVSH